MTSSLLSPSLPASLSVGLGEPSETTSSPRRPIRIIAVDPGEITGVAVLQIINDHKFFISTELPAMKAVQYVAGYLKEISRFVVVSERYTIPTGRSVVTPQLDAIEVNGALRYIVTVSDYIHTFELQGRAEAKKILTNKQLKQLGWFKESKDNHANDAARHIGLAMLNHFPVQYEQLMSVVQST